MPTNLYGYYDNFDPVTSHVLPALMRKFHEAKVDKKECVEVWGTGKVLREFLFVEDLADALLFLMNSYNDDTHINVGTGTDVSIGDLALLMKKVTGYEGEIRFDLSKPDGTPRKLLDVSRLNNAGWKAKTSLEEGIGLTYKWYLENNS